MYIALFLIMLFGWILSKTQKYVYADSYYHYYKELSLCKKIKYFYNKHYIEIILMLVMFLFLSYRNETIGVDLGFYSLHLKYVEYEIDFARYEILYHVLECLVVYLNLGLRWIIIFEAGIFCYAVWKLLQALSCDKILSLIIMYSVGYFAFACCLLRQIIALSFLILGILHMIKSSIKRCYLYILIAALFHSSAIIFVVVPFLYKFKLKAWHLIFVLVCNIVFILCGRQIMLFMGDILKIKYFQDYAAQQHIIPFSAWLTLIIQIIGYIVLFVYNRRVSSDDDINNLCLWQMLIFLEVRLLANILNQLFITRILVYCLIFLAVLVPNLLKSLQGLKNKKLVACVNIIMFIGLFVYMFEQYYIDDYYGVMPYLFG